MSQELNRVAFATTEWNAPDIPEATSGWSGFPFPVPEFGTMPTESELGVDPGLYVKMSHERAVKWFWRSKRWDVASGVIGEMNRYLSDSSGTNKIGTTDANAVAEHADYDGGWKSLGIDLVNEVELIQFAERHLTIIGFAPNFGEREGIFEIFVPPQAYDEAEPDDVPRVFHVGDDYYVRVRLYMEPEEWDDVEMGFEFAHAILDNDISYVFADDGPAVSPTRNTIIKIDDIEVPVAFFEAHPGSTLLDPWTITNLDADMDGVPAEYWPYENLEGQPVWDTVTGINQNPNT